MQHAGIAAGGDDRRVGKAAAALTNELMRELGLDLELMHARLHKLQQAVKAIAGDADGFALGAIGGGEGGAASSLRAPALLRASESQLESPKM